MPTSSSQTLVDFRRLMGSASSNLTTYLRWTIAAGSSPSLASPAYHPHGAWRSYNGDTESIRFDQALGLWLAFQLEMGRPYEHSVQSSSSPRD